MSMIGKQHDAVVLGAEVDAAIERVRQREDDRIRAA